MLRDEQWQLTDLLEVVVAVGRYFFAGRNVFHLPLQQLQTPVFAMLVFTGQSNVYLVREPNHIWRSRPSHWLMVGSAADLFIVSLFATKGILMAALRWSLVLSLLFVMVAFTFFVDSLKLRIFGYFGAR